MPGRPLTRDEILDLFQALSAELDPSNPAEVVVVGGSFMALRHLRDTTEDVDSIRQVEPYLRDAVARVASTRHLDPEWLNDHSRAFAPDDPRTAETVFETATLRVQVASADDVFLMKLDAGREQDRLDMIALWPHCSFDSPDAAVQQFYERMPMTQPDPHLVEFVTEIASAAQRR